MQKNGFSDCSMDQMNIIKGVGNNINTKGVMQFVVNSTSWVGHQSGSDLMAIVKTELDKDGFTCDEYDHCMIVMPVDEDISTSNYAEADVNGKFSIFFNDTISRLSYTMHELGHNYGYMHSGWRPAQGGNGDYGDYTCLMGDLDETNSDFDLKKICLNGPKSWLTGWYSDAHTTVIPTSQSWGGKIATMNDHVESRTTNEHRMIVKIEGPSPESQFGDPIQDDLYLMFYSQSDTTVDNSAWGDSVAITSQASKGVNSYIEGFAKAQQPYRVHNWGGSNNDLVIEVCYLHQGNEPHYAYTLVYLDDGVNNLSCGGTFPPTSSPTPACPSNQDKLTIEIKTDSFGSETSWWFKQKGLGKIKVVPKGTYPDKSILDTYTHCLQTDKW